MIYNSYNQVTVHCNVYYTHPQNNIDNELFKMKITWKEQKVTENIDI